MTLANYCCCYFFCLTGLLFCGSFPGVRLGLKEAVWGLQRQVFTSLMPFSCIKANKLLVAWELDLSAVLTDSFTPGYNECIFFCFNTFLHIQTAIQYTFFNCFQSYLHPTTTMASSRRNQQSAEMEMEALCEFSDGCKCRIFCIQKRIQLINDVK